MSIGGIVFGKLTDMGDHFHLGWRCPDCGTSGFVPGGNGPCRFVCAVTGRAFVVLEFEVQPEVSQPRKQRKQAA